MYGGALEGSNKSSKISFSFPFSFLGLSRAPKFQCMGQLLDVLIL
jgi:hypothetical protein